MLETIFFCDGDGLESPWKNRSSVFADGKMFQNSFPDKNRFGIQEDFRMWTVVYMAQNKEDADSIGKILEEKGLLTKVRTMGENGDDEEMCYEILVPESEVNEAHEIIIENNI